MDGVEIQTQNFNSGNVGDPLPNNPKSKKGIAVVIIILAVVILAAAAYFFLAMNKSSEPVAQTGTMTGPSTAPQVAGPASPPPAASDSLSSINSDLNAIDLNALDKSTQADTNAINSAL